MTFTIPDNLLRYFKGYRTYGAGLIAIGLPYLQPYLPWITPQLASELVWAALAAAVMFARAGSKNDAADAIEALEKFMKTPVVTALPEK